MGLEEGRADEVGLLALAGAPREHPLPERALHQRDHPEALGER
jgi:hypothetical protein